MNDGVPGGGHFNPWGPDVTAPMLPSMTIHHSPLLLDKSRKGNSPQPPAQDKSSFSPSHTPIIFMSTLLRSSPAARTLFTSTLTKPRYLPQLRSFHQTLPIMVKAGDAIPSIPLTESNPGDKVDLSKLLASGKGLIIGVPAAFSTSCRTLPLRVRVRI